MADTITKESIGLGNVENYAPASMAESTNPEVSNKYSTPKTVNYAIDRKLSSADNSEKGLIKTNSGLELNDDTDSEKALTAAGFNSLLNTNTTNFNIIQENINYFLRRRITDALSVVNNNPNQISIITPNRQITNKLSGIIRFTSLIDNTSATYVSSGGIYQEIVTWDNQSLVGGEIVKDKAYALLPLNDKFIILNPTTQRDTGFVQEIEKHVLEINPHPQYLTVSAARDIYNAGFRGSYIGTAVLTDNNYVVELPGIVATSGMFAIKFNSVNPVDSTLTIGGVTKPLLTMSGNALPANIINQNDLVIITNTPDGFYIYSNDTSVALSAHINSGDAHAVATQTANGFMSKEDKLKLDNLSSQSVETAETIISKFDNDVIDIGVL
jgi:hypothetical protein